MVERAMSLKDTDIDKLEVEIEKLMEKVSFELSSLQVAMDMTREGEWHKTTGSMIQHMGEAEDAEIRWAKFKKRLHIFKQNAVCWEFHNLDSIESVLNTSIERWEKKTVSHDFLKDLSAWVLKKAKRGVFKDLEW